MTEFRIDYSQLFQRSVKQINEELTGVQKLFKTLFESSFLTKDEIEQLVPQLGNSKLLPFLISKCHNKEDFKTLLTAFKETGNGKIADILNSSENKLLEPMHHIKDAIEGGFIGLLIGDVYGTALGTRFYRYFLVVGMVSNYFYIIKHKTAAQNLKSSDITTSFIEISKCLMDNSEKAELEISDNVAKLKCDNISKYYICFIALPITLLTTNDDLNKLSQNIQRYLSKILGKEEDDTIIFAGAIFHAVVIRVIYQYKITQPLIEYTDRDRNIILQNIEQSLKDPSIIIQPSVSSNILESINKSDVIQPSVSSNILESINKLNVIRDLISQTDISTEQIRQKLGNSWKSYELPLFCFLMSFNQIPINGLQIINDQFQKAIQLAISVGGEVSFHASITSAITGIFVGHSRIPSDLTWHCENLQEITELANDFMLKFGENTFVVDGSEYISKSSASGIDNKCNYELCNQLWPFQQPPSATITPDKSSRLFPTQVELITINNIGKYLEPNDYCIHKSFLRAETALEKDKLKFNCSYLYKRNWRLLTSWDSFEIRDTSPVTLNCNAFYNVLSSQLIIQIANTNNAGRVKSLASCAYSFTKKIISFYGNISESVTITGYGIGGYIAQIVTVAIEYNLHFKKKYKFDIPNLVETGKHCNDKAFEVHFHCISFNSPPFKFISYPESLLWFFDGIEGRPVSYSNDLDIRVYLPEKENITGQIGAIYFMRTKTYNVETLDGMLDFWLTYEDNGMWDTEDLNIVNYVNGEIDKNWCLKFSMFVFNAKDRTTLFTVIKKRNNKSSSVEYAKETEGFEFLTKDFILNGNIINIEHLVKEEQAPYLNLNFKDTFIKGMKNELHELQRRKLANEWFGTSLVKSAWNLANKAASKLSSSNR